MTVLAAGYCRRMTWVGGLTSPSSVWTVQLGQALVKLAEDAHWKKAVAAQFGGHAINATEGRAVLHMALRGDPEDDFQVGGDSVMEEVMETRDAFLGFADDVRNGDYVASDGGAFTHVVNIGIGGSDLGPVMVHEALAPVRIQDGAPLDVRFVSNVDPFHLDQALLGLDPEANPCGDRVQDLYNPRNHGQCPAGVGLARGQIG